MNTAFRYERSKPSTAALPDSYNAVAYTSTTSSSRSTKQQAPLEYWTNGTTTLIIHEPDFDYPRTSAAASETTANYSSSFLSSYRTAADTGAFRSRRMETSEEKRQGRHKTRPRYTTSNKAAQKAGLQSDPNVVRNSLISGSVAGVTSTLACHPFDVIRTKMQTAAIESSLAVGGKPPLRSATSGPAQVISQTLKNGGFRALYTGLALPLAAQAIYKSTVFTVNNLTQKFLINWNTQERFKTGFFEPYSLTLSDAFICGFVGGAVNATLFVTPVEYVRNQLISQHSRRAAGQTIHTILTGPMDVIRSTARHCPAGVLGLWRGIGVTVARDSIGCGCFFYAMEWSQQRYADQNGTGRPPSLGVTIFSGALAGLSYWIASLPLDTIKTWVQSGVAESATEAIKQSLRDRGPSETLQRLFSGFQVAYARGIPSAAITVTTYSFCYRALKEGYE